MTGGNYEIVYWFHDFRCVSREAEEAIITLTATHTIAYKAQTKEPKPFERLKKAHNQRLNDQIKHHGITYQRSLINSNRPPDTLPGPPQWK